MEISIKWNVCRICMEEESKKVVLSLIFEEPTLPNEIFLCSGVELKKTDNLPDKICNRCLTILKHATKFRITCRKTTDYLNHIILKTQTASKIFKSSKTAAETEVTFDNIDFLEEEQSVEVDEEIVDRNETQYAEDNNIVYIQDVENPENVSVKTNELHEMPAIDTDAGDSVMEDNCESQTDEFPPPDEDSIKFSDQDEQEYEIAYISEEDIKQELEEELEEVDKDEIISFSETLSQINDYIQNEDETPEQSLKEGDYSKPLFRKYIRRVTPNQSYQYICDVCGNHFSKKSMLSFHMKIHRNEKNYMCEICSKRFNSPCNLRAHIRVHTGEKPFQCQFCDRKFSDRSTQIKHERIHTNEKPYTCLTCGKAFSLSTSLKAHEKMHSGERPYKCSPCSKAFTLPHQLKAHLQTNMHRMATEVVDPTSTL